MFSLGKNFHSCFPEWLNQLEGRIKNILSPSLVCNIFVSSICATYMERNIRTSLICASPVKQDWKLHRRKKGYCVPPYLCLLCAFFLPDILRSLLSSFLLLLLRQFPLSVGMTHHLSFFSLRKRCFSLFLVFRSLYRMYPVWVGGSLAEPGKFPAILSLSNFQSLILPLLASSEANVKPFVQVPHVPEVKFIYLFFSSLFSLCCANFCCSFFECTNSSLCFLWSVVEFIHWIFSLLLYFSGLKCGSSLYLLFQGWHSLLSHLVSSVLHWSNFLLASGTSFSENSTICVVLVLASVDHLS